MTESERVARELLAYRDNPPVRQAGLVEGQWYESGDILWIIMAPRSEFTTYELLTRLAELMGRGTCKDIGSAVFECSECGCKLDLDDVECEPTMWVDGVATVPLFCPNCGRKVEA